MLDNVNFGKSLNWSEMEVHTWVEWEVDWVTIINTYLNRATKNVFMWIKSAIKIEFYVTPARPNSPMANEMYDVLHMILTVSREVSWSNL